MLKTESNARDSHKLYREISTNPIDCRPYLLIGENFRKFLLDKVLQGEEVTLPGKLGTLSIIGTKRRLTFDSKGVPKLPPNWKKTKELWDSNPDAKATKKLVFCTNEHSSGVVYKFHWSKKRVPIENKTIYSLRLTKGHKTAINKMIEKGKEYLIKNIN